MAAVLLLVRHGNTFNAGDKVVWCGARTDLPLTEAGEAQARALGERLRGLGVGALAGFLCGPLKRTKRAAELIAECAGWARAAVETEALREIDYGAWEALSTEEIEALDGGDALTAWNKSAVWPKAVGWTPLPEEILHHAGEMMAAAAVRGGLSVVVTSNGILRFFGLQVAAEKRPAALKVATGHVCVLVHGVSGWEVRQWNVAPHEVVLPA